MDESGNPDGNGGPFVICAVQCPRSYGEQLAEHLIDAGLNPWRNKSNSLSVADRAKATQDRRVKRLVASLDSTPVTWCAAVGWEAYNVPKRAAIACTVSSKALTTPHDDRMPDFEGDAVLLHDGNAETYGDNQFYLRKKASAQFNASFQSAICSVYVSSLPDADLTYPEVTTADYIAGYVRKTLADGEIGIRQLPKQVIWVSSDWTCEDVQPAPLYWLRTSGAKQTATEQSRVIAWIEGRRPPKSGFSSGRRFERVVETRLESETLKQYLTELA
ncbi:hypothetical protein [Halorussus caseinilyticus]|uniref:hypothetical protein n=1 Tax=Halorussus caseinilyticus TaxID=3034025 RepID=UPI0023E7A295|nr:hypothetical protein [Halorussus sp. DT72]